MFDLICKVWVTICMLMGGILLLILAMNPQPGAKMRALVFLAVIGGTLLIGGLKPIIIFWWRLTKKITGQ